MWPEVEQRGSKPLETSKKAVSSSFGKGKASSVNPNTQANHKPFTSSREYKPNQQITGKRIPTVLEKKNISVQKKPLNTTIKSTQRTTLAPKSAGTNLNSTKPKALSLKDNNTQISRTNGAKKSKLEDFENDQLGKSIQAKIRRAEQGNGFEGFEL